MQKEAKSKCKYALSIQFESMDDLLKFTEEIKQKKDELGVVSVEWIEKRALDKAAHLVERKEKKQREKSISLGSDRAFLAILEKFSNNKEKDVFTEGGVRQ